MASFLPQADVLQTSDQIWAGYVQSKFDGLGSKQKNTNA